MKKLFSFGKKGKRGKSDEEKLKASRFGVKEVMIPVDKLRIGMRVTRLDRPWEETKFLYQGLDVSRVEEIEYLKEVCHHVYVDAMRLLPNDTRHDTSDVHVHKTSKYPIKRSLEAELPRSRQVYTELRHNFFTVLEEVQRSDSIDIEVVKPLVAACVESIVANPSALFWLTRIKNRDAYTAEHSLRVCILGVSLGRELNVPRHELDVLGLCALLHDVGKMKVPDEVLNKPGRLTPEEMEVMKTHTEHGHALLIAKEGLPDIVPKVALHHHEQVSGQGYPSQLAGDMIPRFARLVSIVDAYDAMTSERCYKDPMPSMDALSILYRCRGTHFDQEMVEAFIRLVGLYPPGGLVELATGEVGIVISNNQSRLKPTIMLRLNAKKEPMPKQIIDLSQEENADLTILRSLPSSAYGLNLLSVMDDLGRDELLREAIGKDRE